MDEARPKRTQSRTMGRIEIDLLPGRQERPALSHEAGSSLMWPKYPVKYIEEEIVPAGDRGDRSGPDPAR
jgi:hypothetical protein